MKCFDDRSSCDFFTIFEGNWRLGRNRYDWFDFGRSELQFRFRMDWGNGGMTRHRSTYFGRSKMRAEAVRTYRRQGEQHHHRYETGSYVCDGSRAMREK